MKKRTDSPKAVRGDSATFENLMRKLIAVPHEEIKAQAEAERELSERFFGVSRVSGAAAKRGC